jgi:type I restriction enzyme S subunit
MMREGIEIPKGWIYVSLGEIFPIERGGSPRPIKKYITDAANGLNWIKIGDTKGVTKYIYHTKEKIKPEGLQKTRMVFVDDFILSNSMSFGRPFIMKTEGCIHDGWLVIRTPKNLINTDYLYYILGASFVYHQFTNLAKGSTVKNLNIEAVEKVYIYLPPLPEQHRIVAKIEELFSRLDKGIESLKTAKEQLKTYRQAVLKWAFEGRFTHKDVKEVGKTW